MAKKKSAKKTNKPRREVLVYAGLSVIIILLASMVAVLVDQRSEDKLTAWAFVKSNELHTFFKDCRLTGGTMDVRPAGAPQIVFVCNYDDKMVEYTMLPPGSNKK